MTTGKTIALTRRTFVSKLVSLLFNMLSRLVITFLSRNKRLLISWLQSPSAVILEPKKIKSLTVTTVSPSISHEVMGLDAMFFVFWMLSFKPTFSRSSFTFITFLFLRKYHKVFRSKWARCFNLFSNDLWNVYIHTYIHREKSKEANYSNCGLWSNLIWNFLQYVEV